jgi:GNAT superfamily N-acetyltransferase
MSIVIRPAVRADVPALVEFNRAMALETESKQLDLAVLGRGVGGVFDDPRRGFYLVATDGDAVVGGLMVTYEWSDWRDGDWWWIQSVFVRSTHRRLGVYSQLHREVERLARAAGAVGIRLYVEWDNRSAQQTYRTLGMDQAHYHMFQQPFVAIA